jgi:hypothetical protein
MAIPTVSQPDEDETTVLLTFEMPEERGSAITHFQIEFLASTGDFLIVPDLCDGTTQEVLLNLSCEFEMLMLLEEPLNLIQGDLITVRVRAANGKGWGDFSEQNTQG